MSRVLPWIRSPNCSRPRAPSPSSVFHQIAAGQATVSRSICNPSATALSPSIRTRAKCWVKRVTPAWKQSLKKWKLWTSFAARRQFQRSSRAPSASARRPCGCRRASCILRQPSARGRPDSRWSWIGAVSENIACASALASLFRLDAYLHLLNYDRTPALSLPRRGSGQGVDSGNPRKTGIPEVHFRCSTSSRDEHFPLATARQGVRHSCLRKMFRRGNSRGVAASGIGPARRAVVHQQHRSFLLRDVERLAEPPQELHPDQDFPGRLLQDNHSGMVFVVAGNVAPGGERRLGGAIVDNARRRACKRQAQRKRQGQRPGKEAGEN